ncbi:ribosome modulation factor [Salinispirillum sp. LH 10-3-1]|uniref:Ribosome modulation factor n=1 Tax=Salinispirillum sp. LH 10-3-1 TaxID=2952525 RepID=A0AB38YHT2_9GAMM
MSQAKKETWDIDKLNEAYQKGYFVGLTSKGLADCPFLDQEVLASAWEAGWHDGYEALQLSGHRGAARQAV